MSNEPDLRAVIPAAEAPTFYHVIHNNEASRYLGLSDPTPTQQLIMLVAAKRVADAGLLYEPFDRDVFIRFLAETTEEGNRIADTWVKAISIVDADDRRAKAQAQSEAEAQFTRRQKLAAWWKRHGIVFKVGVFLGLSFIGAVDVISVVINLVFG